MDPNAEESCRSLSDVELAAWPNIVPQLSTCLVTVAFSTTVVERTIRRLAFDTSCGMEAFLHHKELTLC